MTRRAMADAVFSVGVVILVLAAFWVHYIVGSVCLGLLLCLLGVAIRGMR